MLLADGAAFCPTSIVTSAPDVIVVHVSPQVAQSLVSAFAKEVKDGKFDTLSFSTAYILYVVFGEHLYTVSIMVCSAPKL